MTDLEVRPVTVTLNAEQLIQQAIGPHCGDPLRQLKELTELIHQIELVRQKIAPVRVELINQLRADDRSMNWIAARVGVSHQSIAQAVRRQHAKDKRPKIERL